MQKYRKTKIVATLGPATSSKEKIEALIDAGVNIFRLNASHGELSEHEVVINIIKSVREEKNIPIAILFDIQGPKIRVGKLENGTPVSLVEGKEIIITSENLLGNQERISTNYPNLANDVKPDDLILLNDGVFVLKVKEISGSDVKTIIMAGGSLTEHKGVNLPGTTSSLSAITPKDEKDIEFAVKHKVDYIALSFVRSAEDIKLLRKHIKESGGDIPVIAKIEKPKALENIEEIIDVSDGIMVARGDLGIELAPHKVPLAQKKLIYLSNLENVFVITATQMLESMIENPLPSRAEASDVANAILDGTDAIMLSAETSVGKYPEKAVKMMDSISLEIESKDYIEIRKVVPKLSDNISADSHAIAVSTFAMSKDLNVDAIVAFTNSGFTAKLLSNFRPNAPIIAITHSEKVSRELNAYWGIIPCVVDIEDTEMSQYYGLDKILKEKTPLVTNDKIVIVGGMPYLVSGITNFIRLHTIK
ncbi:MAG: pyruvate kinase [Cyanobacteriota bacterium]